jgi:hypothetical protein
MLAEEGDERDEADEDEDDAWELAFDTASTTLRASRSSTSIEKLKSRISVGISRFSRPWTVSVRVVGDCGDVDRDTVGMDPKSSWSSSVGDVSHS